MASTIIGRRPCLLLCGFDSAHVKRSERCTYMFCPGCGLNGPHAKTEQQVDLMTAGMRPVGEGVPVASPPTPTPTPGPAPAATAPPAEAPAPTPTPTPRRRGLF